MNSTSSTVRTSASHIETFRPTFCKVLVRYNPEGDAATNQRQSERLKRLSDYLHSGGPTEFMFELLVPATPAQLQRSGGDKKEYDLGLRPELMVRCDPPSCNTRVSSRTSGRLRGSTVPRTAPRVVAAVRRGGRDRVGCIVLGRGEDDAKVREWLTTAASVPGFIGFAVGRTSFWEPLTDWKNGRIRGTPRSSRSPAVIRSG